MWHGRKQVICHLLQLLFEIIKQCRFIGVRTFCPTNSSPHGCFAPWTCGKRLDVSPHVHRAKRLWVNRLWGEMSIVGRIAHAAKRPRMGRNVHGALSLPQA